MQEETLRMPEGDSVRATEVEETMLLLFELLSERMIDGDAILVHRSPSVQNAAGRLSSPEKTGKALQ